MNRRTSGTPWEPALSTNHALLVCEDDWQESTRLRLRHGNQPVLYCGNAGVMTPDVWGTSARGHNHAL